MDYWIFVINDADYVFKERMKNKTWPIFPKTQNRDNIGKGHKIVFYKAGKSGGQKFIGTAILASDVKSEPGKMNSYVVLDEIIAWKAPVDIRGILEHLDFIKDKLNWGLYMQGGVKRIDKKDFDLVVSVSK